jgi:hypothetical protein
MIKRTHRDLGRLRGTRITPRDAHPFPGQLALRLDEERV